MNFNFSVERKFKINGKEYHSLEEMPEDVRETFKTAMGKAKAGSMLQVKTSAMQAKITFNGEEYDSPEAMPEDARQLYEKVLQAAKAESPSAAPDLPKLTGSSEPEKPSLLGSVRPRAVRSPAQFESSFPSRALIVCVLLGLVILLLYYLWKQP